MLRRFFDRELFPRHDLTACPACVWVVNRMGTNEWGLYEVFVCLHSADKMLDANRSRHWTIGQNGSTVNIPDSVAGEVRAKIPARWPENKGENPSQHCPTGAPRCYFGTVP